MIIFILFVLLYLAIGILFVGVAGILDYKSVMKLKAEHEFSKQYAIKHSSLIGVVVWPLLIFFYIVEVSIKLIEKTIAFLLDNLIEKLFNPKQ